MPDGGERASQRVCDVPWAHLITEGFHKVIWPQVEPLLAKALATDELGRYTTQDVLQELMLGRVRLWVSFDRDKSEFEMAAITQVTQWPQCRECRIWLGGGRNMKAWLNDFTRMVEAYARSEFCGYLTGSGSRAWARVAKNGWHADSVNLVKAL